MFKRNKFYTVVATSALISISAVSTAQQTVNSTATVTVANAFNLVEVAPLDFGQLAVYQNLRVDSSLAAGARTDAMQSSYVVKSDGTANGITPGVDPSAANTVSRVVEIVAGTPAEYSITQATRFTNLDVNLSNANVTFTVADPLLDSTLNSDFTATITEADVTIVGGPNNGNTLEGDFAGGGTMPLRTDTNGNIGFRVGASIMPNPLATAILEGNYVGTYTLTVQY